MFQCFLYINCVCEHLIIFVIFTVKFIYHQQTFCKSMWNISEHQCLNQLGSQAQYFGCWTNDQLVRERKRCIQYISSYCINCRGDEISEVSLQGRSRVVGLFLNRCVRVTSSYSPGERSILYLTCIYMILSLACLICWQKMC